jgi:hypothetical protein
VSGNEIAWMPGCMESSNHAVMQNCRALTIEIYFQFVKIYNCKYAAKEADS